MDNIFHTCHIRHFEFLVPTLLEAIDGNLIMFVPPGMNLTRIHLSNYQQLIIIIVINKIYLSCITDQKLNGSS